MEELKKIIGKNITEQRTKLGMTQLELAQRLCYSDKSVSKWERGESAPDVYVLKSMSELFCVSVDYMLCEHQGSESEGVTDTHGSGSVTASEVGGAGKRCGVLTAIIIAGVWTLAFLLFLILSCVGIPAAAVFVYTLPVSVVVLIVLNSVWRGGRHNIPLVFLLILGLLCSVYTALWQYNVWQIFLLCIPAALILYLCSKLKK